MNFNSLRVSTRLVLGFGSLIGLLAVVVGVGVVRLGGINESVESLVGNRMPKLERTNDAAFKAMDNARIVRNIILLTDEKAVASNKAKLDENLVAIGGDLDFLQHAVSSPAGKEALQAALEARTAYERYTQDVVALGMANKNEEATKTLYGEGYKTQAAYFGALAKLAETQKAAATDTGAAAAASYAGARTVLLAVGAIACLTGIGMAVLITRGLLKQLGGEPGTASAVAHAVADGDLTVAIETRPGDTTSLMAQLQTMQTSLAKVVADVRQNSESVATASAQIAQGNNDLSGRTEQQASALEETAASMEQLGSTVKQNADNARQANQLALSASTVAVRGGEVVGQVVETMKGINESSKKIADIISVIDGIAFQTNILALNAAVEAARAGEQGRGFAVVASEVRSLAQRSAEAAKEIKSLITASVERVEQGSTLVDQAGATMTEVVGSIRRVTDIMGEISAASVEQSAGVAQVGEAVSQMDRATQQNAALVEESAAAAESLKTQAQQLVQAVAVFKVAHGNTADAPARTPPPAATAGASQPVADRRGPGRAKNVVRPAFRARPAAVPAAAATEPAAPAAGTPARTGTDDWESF